MSCGRWHAQWQRRMAAAGAAHVEAEFLPLEGAHSRRVADVACSHGVFELQHSYIAGAEVQRRDHDYALHGLRTDWLVDGNSGVDVFAIDDGRILLEFTDTWKYNSFRSKDVVFLERQGTVYTFRPDAVRYGTTIVSAGRSIQDFIDAFLAGTATTPIAAHPQHTLYVHQQGAGNGKTYDAVQRCANDPRFAHKETFIILIKTHPAKEVIMQEFANQLKCNLLEIEEGSDEVQGVGKQYKITFRRADNGEESVILAGTIDSFIWALGRGADVTPGVNMFEACCRAVAGGHAVYDNAAGSMRYAGTSVRLNQRCIVIVDEAQDLPMFYLEALAAVVRRTNIDVQLVGDRLQSVWGYDNMFTQASPEYLADIHCVFADPKNDCRRFHHTCLKDMVNDVVNFEAYHVPPIAAICDGGPQCKHRSAHDDVRGERRVEVVVQPSPHNREAMQAFRDGILHHLDALVEARGYVPESFLFVFPVMKGNELAAGLVEMLQEYWENKFRDPAYRRDVLDVHPYWGTAAARADKFRMYAYLHRSDEGRPMDMTLSERATRLVSIHSAKGDGRDHVYVFNLSQYTLEKFTDGEMNGQSESLLHVALTRMKEGIVVGVCDVDDDIGRRFHKYLARGASSILPCGRAYASRSSLSVRHLLTAGVGEDWAQRLHAAYFGDVPPLEATDKDAALIEWGHHAIRGHVMRYNLLACATTHGTGASDSIRATLAQVAKAPVVSCNARGYREVLHTISDRRNDRQADTSGPAVLPILRFGQDAYGAQAQYHDRLMDTIRDVQKALRASPPNQLPAFGPLLTCMTVYAMEVLDNGRYSDFNAMEMYEILHSFQGGTGDADLGSHYRLAQRVERQFARAMEDLRGASLKFLPSYPVAYYGHTDDFKIFTCVPLVAVASEEVILFYTRPSINELNRHDVLMAALWDTFIVKNTGEGIGKDKGPHRRFGKRRVSVCVITLDDVEPLRLRLLDGDSGGDAVFREFVLRTMLDEQRPKALWQMYEKELGAHCGDQARAFKSVRGLLEQNPYARTVFERAQKGVKRGARFDDVRALEEYIEDDLRMWLDIETV